MSSSDSPSHSNSATDAISKFMEAFKANPAPAVRVIPDVDVLFLEVYSRKCTHFGYDAENPKLLLEWIFAVTYERKLEPSDELVAYLASKSGVTASEAQVREHLLTAANEGREIAVVDALMNYLPSFSDPDGMVEVVKSSGASKPYTWSVEN